MSNLALVQVHNCEVDDGTLCESCCQHEEHDHGVCMDCGADRTEFLAGKAEDIWEGER